MALLTVAILTLQELARTARSAEKLLDSLNRELPATLQDLRLTGKDLAVLTNEVSGSVQSARSVVQQVDQSLLEAKAQAQKAQVTTRSLLAGATAALKVLTGQPRRRRNRPPTRRPPVAVPLDRPLADRPSADRPSASFSHTNSEQTNSPTDSQINSHNQPAPAPPPAVKKKPQLPN